MSPQKKRVWYKSDVPALLPMLISIPCGAVLYFLAGPVAGTVAFYLVLLGATVIFAMKQDPMAVADDERTQMLRGKAKLIIAWTFLSAASLACAILLIACELQGRETIAISVRNLAGIMLGGIFLFGVTGIITDFVLFHRGMHNGEE